MPKKTKSENVPKKMESTYNSIISLTDKYCKKHLNEEYAQLSRRLTAALCRKRPSPLTRGKPESWACGIIYALGHTNFLFDKNMEPYVSAAELCEGFGVSTSTGYSKSSEIRKLMNMTRFDPNWSTAEMIDKNPMIWLIKVGGFVTDVRTAPPDIQQKAYEAGLIPYIPGRKGEEKPKKRGKKAAAGKTSLYTLEVALISGPITEDFLKQNPTILRIIEIRGDQTLDELHDIIFKAFDREDKHLYEFQLKGKGPGDPDAEKYLHPAALEGEEKASTDFTLEELNLEVDEFFGYWFDFGDDWWHQIRVMSIEESVPRGKYPRITRRVGESPPQYADFDE